MHSNRFMYTASSCIAAASSVAVGPSPMGGVSPGSSLHSNTCMKLLTRTHFRYDPYSAAVIPTEFASQSPQKLSGTSIVALSVSPPASPIAELRTTATCEPVSMSVSLPELMPTVNVRSALVVAPAPSVHGVRFAVVKFKQETATFIAPFRIVVGETVVVEGDRGENVGVVQEITQAQPSFDVTSRVIRRATDKDLATLQAQREREQATLKFTQSLASTLGLHASIEDVEYQFDLNKLTIFVRRSAKNGFVDFRKLQRSLFREYRCRIWCAYMDEVEAIENAPRSR